VIKLEATRLGYNRKVVLKGINLKVKQGEIVGLIGPNASGKSTLLKGISRLIRPFSGRIFVDGKDVATIKREALARLVAAVPQNPSLPVTFTAFELVLMGRTPCLGRFRYEGKRDMEITWQAMEQTQTQYLAWRKVGELSGGEKQRLVIARALTQQPKVILLDEPTANLDIKHQISTLKFIVKLSDEQGLTAMIAQHDLNLAAQFSDRVVLLHRGTVHAKGAPSQVITAENIREVYGVEIDVYPHPTNELPLALITGERSATPSQS
jgi:iron complex transport system ATP-binding protein